MMRHSFADGQIPSRDPCECMVAKLHRYRNALDQEGRKYG
jgi:hypothetical protein